MRHKPNVSPASSAAGWSRPGGALPRNLQQLIFEQAVLAGHRSERDESLREQLAAFLHERHPRTAGMEPTEMAKR